MRELLQLHLIELLQLVQLLLLLLLIAQPEQHGALPDQVHVQLAQVGEHLGAELAAPLAYAQVAHVVLVDLAQRGEQVDEGVDGADGVEQGRLRRAVDGLQGVLGLG